MMTEDLLQKDPPEDILERREELLQPPDPDLYSLFSRMVTDGGARLVVSFGGGSVPGLCGNVALARILEELNLRQHVQEVWGTSAGAAIGGPWASGTEALTILKRIAALDRPRSVDIAWGKLLGALMLRPFGRKLPDGLIAGRHFKETIDACLSKDEFSDCPTPFRCIACTDDGRATKKVFRRGKLLPAILSSMSIPGVMMPRNPEPDEKTGFYDGGLLEKTPLSSPISEHQRLHSKSSLVLLGTHYGNEARAVRARGFVNRFLSCIHAMESVCWDYQLDEAHKRPNVQLLMLNPRISDPNLFDFARVERNYLEARAVFLSSLQNGRIALTFGSR